MANKDELISFFEVLSIEGNQQKLTELEQSLVESLSQTFECNIGVARELFGRLLVGLKTWTTTERHIQQVFLEDVYSVLGFEEDIDDSQHRLAAPYPFFESRQVFCEELDKKLLSTEKKVVFLSGDPGSGKTSTISYLQATTSKCRRSVFRWRKFGSITLVVFTDSSTEIASWYPLQYGESFLGVNQVICPHMCGSTRMEIESFILRE